MHYISKHFTADNYEQLILDKTDWSEEVWQALCTIFGFADVERMIISEYKLDACTEQKE